ncbi:MAG TPA: hypothetical protein VHT75_14560 [Acidimicrobiales bacterium]|nr:hypothetical protein [Acidimicrobiales bacterium]
MSIVVCAAVIAASAGCSGGGSNASGKSSNASSGSNAKTVSFSEYQGVVENGAGQINLAPLKGYNPDPNAFGATNELSPADCDQAGTDVQGLVATTAKWPSVLAKPMAQAEDQWNAAVAACSNQQFSNMTTDLQNADHDVQATRQAYDAHCKMDESHLDVVDC